MRSTESIHGPGTGLGAGQIAVRTYLYEKEAIKHGKFDAFKVHREFPQAHIPPATIRVSAEKLIPDTFTLRLAAGELVRVMEALKVSVDAIVGVPSGATALAAEACHLMGRHRKFSGVVTIPVEKRGDGFEVLQPAGEGRRRVVIVEDVMTTGTSSLKLAKELEEVGYEVVVVVALVDREQWGRERLAKRGYAVGAVLTLKQVLHGQPEYEEDMAAEWAMREKLEEVFAEELS